jgi:hypothetical protein
MQIKTTLIFNPTPVRMAMINQTNNNIVKDAVKQEPLHTVGGNAN